MRRQQLSETQIAALFDPPAEPRELVRYYTLTETDSAMVRRCRGDHSRLGYALMLCYLRHPGRPLWTNERPSAALVSFVAEQIDVRPEAIGDYLASEQNRRRMLPNCRTGFGAVPSGSAPRRNSPTTFIPGPGERSPLSSGRIGHGGKPFRRRAVLNASVLIFAFERGG